MRYERGAAVDEAYMPLADHPQLSAQGSEPNLNLRIKTVNTLIKTLSKIISTWYLTIPILTTQMIDTTVLGGKAFIGGRSRERRPVPKDTSTVLPALSASTLAAPTLSALALASQSRQKALKERGEMYNNFDDT